ncbi:MAG TPA: Scr1 family TA system antitoxin-like transcriptional regulator [Verrucomicrobiae bacterium]|nr:Scr1 family TA system antitoxin-like transcriptional regulator [Verrucomicrobiae bacterium]
MATDFQVGLAIRTLRQEHQLTGEQLGRMVGMSQAKISRIETGAIGAARSTDIEAILNILNASQTIRQQFALISERGDSVQIHRFATLQFRFEQTYRREQESKSIRMYVVGGIPALLQTLAYRRELLQQLLAAKDLARALKTITRRQDLLFEPSRRFHFIMPETVLYTRIAHKAVQYAQLDRIGRLLDLHTVAIGIVPMETGLSPLDNCTFGLYDDRFLMRAITDGEIYTEDPTIIAAHHRLFSELERKADYGHAAQTLIEKAQRYFGQTVVQP